jgi:D-3-phosphoglycerate dehydrogenase
MSEFVLAAWGEFLSPSFDRVIEDAGIDIVRVARESTPVEAAPDCDALYVRLPSYASAEIIGGLSHCKALAVPGAGIEVIDVDAATARGIPVLSGQGMGPEPIADWTIGAIVWLVRRMGELHEAMKRGDWASRFANEHRHDMRVLTFGIVGYGQIGRRVAAILSGGFGAKVLVTDSAPRAREAAEEAGLEVVELDELVRRSDVVTLHAQAQHGEPPVLGADQLATLKPGSLVVNTARGALLDYDALYDALRDGRLAGAGLDVHAKEPPDQDYVDRFAALPNVLLAPHQGGMTVDAIESLSVGVASSIVEVLRGGRPWNCANPQVWETAAARD